MNAALAADFGMALFAALGVLAFGWRSWLQYRRTGSSGVRVLRGGATERLAGGGLAVALVVAGSAPILQRVNAIGPIAALSQGWIQVAGIAIATAGLVATVCAQLAMGDSWRMGVDEHEATTLVHTGVFGLVRNPIYSSMLSFGFGAALLTPNLIAWLGFILLLASIELQVRRVEEPYLLGRHGDEYRAYTARAGRFLPGIGRVR